MISKAKSINPKGHYSQIEYSRQYSRCPLCHIEFRGHNTKLFTAPTYNCPARGGSPTVYGKGRCQVPGSTLTPLRLCSGQAVRLCSLRQAQDLRHGKPGNSNLNMIVDHWEASARKKAWRSVFAVGFVVSRFSSERRTASRCRCLYPHLPCFPCLPW